MAEVIEFNKFLAKNTDKNKHIKFEESFDLEKVERIRDLIEAKLYKMENEKEMPLVTAMAAGRFAAMRLFQLQGRAETMAFFDQCIVTAELWDDFSGRMDEDA
jgi:hypothetical protein